MMHFRCDQVNDCVDQSDEKNCKMVVFDHKNYAKGKPPRGSLLKLKLDLLKILEISEIDMTFKTQFKLYSEWNDERLQFLNLHEEKFTNQITENEKQQIWLPTIIFENTDLKLRSKKDIKAALYVDRRGTFNLSSIDHIDNEHIYEGKSNALEISRIYNTAWQVVYILTNKLLTSVQDL